MKYTTFKDEMMRMVAHVAPSHSPEHMANALYFMIKQNPQIPVSKVTSRPHQSMLRSISNFLFRKCGWKLSTIHQFLAKYNGLVRHMKKKT
ncbi:MAG: hypothetical protein ACTSSP_05685 [Candidatus Asgardarchaeia archaeon]